MLMLIIGFIIFGLVVGALARLLMPGPDPMGVGATIVLGIVGSLVAGLIARALWGTGVGLIGSVLGAVLLLAIWRAATRDRGGVRV
jgi:uncharacterized membrane protein YeaQ/YmgE (transglycosylase-associated protein family)